MTNKERAEATYEALQKRKRDKLKKAKSDEYMGLNLTIDSIRRHRGRKHGKYFF